MKIVAGIVVIAVLAAVAEYFLPWWVIAIVPLPITLAINKGKAASFLTGFAGIALCWLAIMLYRDIPNQHILSTRMAGLFKLPGYSAFIAVVTILGGLIGGLSGLAGGLLREPKH